jgi:AhpC/TSA antioxidant enzyme
MTTSRTAPTLVDWPVEGRNLTGATFAEAVCAEPTLVVFLRHFGCLFCREVVRDLREVSESDPGYPRVVFVHQGTPSEGDTFFARLWPEVDAISDPSARLYRHFGVERGNLAQMFGPRSTACAVRAMVKGNGIGKKVGDGWTLPTVFLVDDRKIVWIYNGEHAGDHPDWRAIARQAA